MITIDSKTYRSPNHHTRTKPIDALVLHSGEGTKASDLDLLIDPTPPPKFSRVSCGYYVDRAGNVYCLVDDSRAAWHAGQASYLGITDWNEISIGIETEHKNGQDWPPVQLAALRELCMMLIAKYDIEQKMVVAHRWIAPDRKIDPTNFPNATLEPWIADLFFTLNRQAWGSTLIPYNPTYRIPTAWRKHKKQLGKVTTAAMKLGDWTVQFFERGFIEYDPHTDLTSVYTTLQRYKL